MKPGEFVEKWRTSIRLMLIGISPSEASAKKREEAEAEFLADAQSAFAEIKKREIELGKVRAASK